MEKLTKKEKQERLQKAKKVAHNVMHIVGYVSLGLLGLILCLTASKCSNAKTQDNVQVQEVARPYEKPQDKIDTTNSVYYINGVADTSNLIEGYYAGSGAGSLVDTNNDSYTFDYLNLEYSDNHLAIELEYNDDTIYSENVDLSVVTTYYTLTFTTEPSNFSSNTLVQNLISNDVFASEPIAVTPVDNNEVIVSLGEAWTDTITGFAGVLASSVNSIVAIFYANNSLTFVGVLLCIAMGVGVVYFAFRLIRNLIRNRG